MSADEDAVECKLIDEPAQRPWHRWIGHRPYGMELDTGACLTKFTELTIKKISLENGLINSRLGWLLTLNGFLFASYALALNSTVPENRLPPLSRLETILATTGIVTAVVALIGIMGAYSAINTHKRRWLANAESAIKVTVQPFAAPLPSLLGRAPAIGFCVTFACVWTYMLAHGV